MTCLSQEEILLAAVGFDPSDFTVRLALADLLLELGRETEAEGWRWTVEKGRTPEWYGPGNVRYEDYGWSSSPYWNAWNWDVDDLEATHAQTPKELCNPDLDSYAPFESPSKALAALVTEWTRLDGETRKALWGWEP